MGFGGGITGPEAAKIFFIEGVKVHWRSFHPVYFSLYGHLTFSGANGHAEARALRHRFPSILFRNPKFHKCACLSPEYPRMGHPIKACGRAGPTQNINR